LPTLLSISIKQFNQSSNRRRRHFLLLAWSWKYHYEVYAA